MTRGKKKPDTSKRIATEYSTQGTTSSTWASRRKHTELLEEHAVKTIKSRSLLTGATGGLSWKTNTNQGQYTKTSKNKELRTHGEKKGGKRSDQIVDLQEPLLRR